MSQDIALLPTATQKSEDKVRGIASDYCNNDCDITEFHPTPKGELNKLTIELMRSDGELYSEAKDNLKINEIDINGSDIDVTLTEYVNKNYFHFT